jgi:hypothetical protein
VTAEEQTAAWTVPPRPTVELTRAESWRLLTRAPLGRVVFTHRAMPAIRPVNHLVDDGLIVIRTHLGAAITGNATADGAVVCYQADDIDPVRHTGWSVVVTGLARLARDPATVRRYQRLLRPWTDGQLDSVVVIAPQLVTGVRLAGWCR